VLALRPSLREIGVVDSSVSNQRAHLVDGHVHFHACFDVETFLEGAVRNFRGGATELGLPPPTRGVLLFTEAEGDEYFKAFRDGDGFLPAPWRSSRTGESHSVITRAGGERELLLIAGRQLVTREGLEVLAIGHADVPKANQTLLETVENVLASGALAIIPWGFGKWWFARGALVADLLDSMKGSEVYLGDNGGRARLSFTPRLFAWAESEGVLVLPGSDPLPFRSQAGRAGRYGFLLEGPLDYERPAESLKRLIRGLGSQPLRYGQREGIFAFAYSQLRMQLRKRGWS